MVKCIKVVGSAKVECILYLHSIMKWARYITRLIDILVEPIVQSLSNYVVEVWSRGMVVTEDQVGVGKGNLDVAKAIKVGLEVENEGTKVAGP
jgi:hypothetical protein